MIKNTKTLEKRQALINLAVKDPKEAAKYFELAALSLTQAQNTCTIVDILANILFLSETTIERDLSARRENQNK